MKNLKIQLLELTILMNVKKIYQIDNLNDKLYLLEKELKKKKMTKTENEL